LPASRQVNTPHDSLCCAVSRVHHSDDEATMFLRPLPHLLIASFLLATTSTAWSQSAENLLPYVPEDANSIAILRIADLKDSPRGRQEDWASQHEAEFLAGSMTLPPWVTVFVRASHVQIGTRQRNWTVAVLPLPDDYAMATLADKEGTEVQDIAGHQAVFAPRLGGYFVELTAEAPRVLGGIAPAGRQQVARWIGESRAGPSAYLREAAQHTDAQIVIALDMQDMLEPALVRYRLDGSAALQDKPQAKTALTLDFQTLRGVQLRVRVAETASAEVRMDFGRSLGDEAQFVKPLLIELVHDAGAALDELEDAAVDVRGRSVTMKMPLSDESLRRILSLVTTPPPASAGEPMAETPPAPMPEASSGSRIDLAASRRYFNAVNQNIDDLQRAYSRAKNYSRTAQWHVNFAERIDHLPTAGVDPALLEYGITIRERLLALAASLRGTAVQIDALNDSVVYNVDVQPAYATGFDWWWGGAHTAWGPYYYGQPYSVNVSSNLQDVRAQQAEVVQASAPDRDQIWQMINDERASVEREMIGKFGPEFKGQR
jgi:hypothetical protein